MGFRHQAQMGLDVGRPSHSPIYRNFKSRFSQMLVNVLQTSGPSWLDVCSPSPRANSSPALESDIGIVWLMGF